MAKAMDGLLWSFYFYCRYTVSAQYVGDTITKRVRHNQQPGLEIRSHQNWNRCLTVHRSQSGLPSPTQLERVRIGLAHFDKAIGKELPL
jgi:hypothetical protein